MKRFHLHMAVEDIEKNVRFYSTLFGAEPAVRKPDYAKWMLEDPRVNFAISKRGAKPGLDHVGIQVDNDVELEDIRSRLARADQAMLEQRGTSCCYAKSDKYWVQDPQGIPWEAYHTLAEVPVFGDGALAAQPGQAFKAACCAPAAR
jgi:catechol 2,3-dioxygenase-like lactoylglutathione lyase family enzyme